MKIQTPETMRQLAYAMRVAEKLAEILLDKDDAEFDPVASELAGAIAKRIGRAIDTLNAENNASSRECEDEELIHSVAKLARAAADAEAKHDNEN